VVEVNNDQNSNNGKISNVNTGASNLLAPLATPMMGSIEIADLVDKRHAHVQRSAKVMLIELHGADYLATLALPKTGRAEYIRDHADELLEGVAGHNPKWVYLFGKAFSWTLDARSYVAEIFLDREHALTLVSGYNVVLRNRIITRLEELEQQVASLPAPIVAAATPVPAIQDQTIANVSKGIIVLDLLAGSKGYGLTHEEHRNGVHKLFRLNGLPTDVLPPPTDDTYSAESTVTHLLRSRGSCLSPHKFYLLLQEEGIVYRFTRPSRTEVDGKQQPVLRASWRFTTKGMPFGFDDPIKESHGRDYQPLFYPARFTELMRGIAPAYERLLASGYKPRWPKDENERHAQEYLAKFSGSAGRNVEATYRAADLR